MIAQARQQVTQAVADALGIPTSPTLPDRLHAPLAAIREADGDFLIPEPEGPYGSWQLPRHDPRRPGRERSDARPSR